MIFFFSRIRRERGGICSCEKWGTEQRRRKRRQTWKCHKKTSECNWCSQWKTWSVPWWGFDGTHRRVSVHHSCTQSTCWGSWLCSPRSHCPSSQTNSSGFWQDSGSCALQCCQLTVLWRTFLWWARGPFAHLLYPSETSLNYLKA